LEMSPIGDTIDAVSEIMALLLPEEEPMQPRAPLCALLSAFGGRAGLGYSGVLGDRLRGFSRFLCGFEFGHALGEGVGDAPRLRVGVAFGLQLLFERGYEVVSGVSKITLMLAIVMPYILGAALVGTSRALVVAQYDVHATALADVGDGAALYPGADGVHGDAEGIGGLGHR
jgi:hypothetical protein